jgi:hypothetical protein
MEDRGSEMVAPENIKRKGMVNHVPIIHSAKGPKPAK